MLRQLYPYEQILIMAFQRYLSYLSAQIRIILNKGDMLTHQQLMRVYGALMWSLSKVRNRKYRTRFITSPLLCFNPSQLLCFSAFYISSVSLFLSFSRFSASPFLRFSVFSVSLFLCLSASPLHCFSPSPLSLHHHFSTSLLLRFNASLFLCFSTSLPSLFSLFLCISASLSSPLLRFSASLLHYFCFLTSPLPHFSKFT